MEVNIKSFFDWYEVRPSMYSKLCIQWDRNILKSTTGAVLRCFDGESQKDFPLEEVLTAYQNWLEAE